jgi:CrcB protein
MYIIAGNGVLPLTTVQFGSVDDSYQSYYRILIPVGGSKEMLKILFIAVGGAVGALLRYWVSGVTYKYLNGFFPWGTLIVNLSGCLIIGFLWQLFEATVASPSLRALFLIGFLGAYTTFSTYALETFNLIRENEVMFALYNFLLNNALGIVFVFFGFVLSRYLFTLLLK